MKITEIKTKQFWSAGGNSGTLKWVAWFSDSKKNGRYEGFGLTEDEAIGNLIRKSQWYSIVSHAK